MNECMFDSVKVCRLGEGVLQVIADGTTYSKSCYFMQGTIISVMSDTCVCPMMTPLWNWSIKYHVQLLAIQFQLHKSYFKNKCFWKCYIKNIINKYNECGNISCILCFGPNTPLFLSCCISRHTEDHSPSAWSQGIGLCRRGCSRGKGEGVPGTRDRVYQGPGIGCTRDQGEGVPGTRERVNQGEGVPGATVEGLGRGCTRGHSRGGNRLAPNDSIPIMRSTIRF